MTRVIWMLAMAVLIVAFASIPASAGDPGRPSAGTATKRIALSGLTHDISVRLNGQFLDSGRLRAVFPECRARRKVLLKGRSADGRVVILDSDRSSIGGAWATQANYDGFTGVKAKVKRSRFLRAPGHPRVCKQDAVTWKPAQQ